MPVAVRHIAAFLLWFLLAAVAASAAVAQATAPGAGLPGGPVLNDTLRDLPKEKTDCARCKPAEQAYHAAVDAYNATRKPYEAALAGVRKSAETFTAAHDKAERLRQVFDAAQKVITDDLSAPPDASLGPSAFRDATDARDAAEDASDKAAAELAKARAGLNSALGALETARQAALKAMRKAIRLRSEMYRCEATCKVSELTLDEPAIAAPAAAPVLINPETIPKPENVLSVVAKCAKCQPLADQVNTIRSHRRSFAVEAQTLYESLTANRATLDRLRHEAVALKAEERAIYRQLQQTFTANAPADNAARIDQVLDAADQKEAADKLKAIAEKRAANARDQAGLVATISDQLKGIAVALANYKVHTALLEAAQKKLADCEKTCEPAGTKQVRVDPFIDPAYPVPENVDPVTAKCAKCQGIADELVKTLVARREVAQEIQSDVWLLKGAKDWLKRAEAKDDALTAEERKLGKALLDGTGNKDTITDRLFDIDVERTDLTAGMLSAEDDIARYRAEIPKLMKKYAALTKAAEALRAKLAACEKTCGERPATSTGDSYFVPGYPKPINYLNILTKCPTCQPLVDQINALLKERFHLASDIQSTANVLKGNKRLWQAKVLRRQELLKREEELLPASTTSEDEKEKAAAIKELNQIDAEREGLDRDLDALDKAIAEDTAALKEMVKKHAALNATLSDLKARLAKCEAACAEKPGNATALPGESPFVTTDCPACAPLASQVNDAVGTLIGAEKALAAAQAKFKSFTAAAAARQAALDKLKTRERDLNEQWLQSDDEAEKKQIDKDLDGVDAARNKLTDEKAGEAAARTALLAEVDAAQAKVDKLKKLVADLKAKLAECEKKCAPAEDGTGMAPGDTAQPPSPFVTTDCAPCEALASLVNDAVGTRIGAMRDLVAAQKKLAELKAQAAARETALKAVLARERALNDEALTGPSAARQKEIDTALDQVDAERNALTDAKAEAAKAMAAAQAAEKAAQAKVDKLTKTVADLKAQLAECEKKCAPPTEGTSLAPGDEGQPPSPFVTTDCAPCEALASLVNDAVGTLIGATRELKAAQDKVAKLTVEGATREAALTAVLARESALNDEWLTRADDARKKEIDRELDDVDAERNALTDAKAAAAKAMAAAQAAVATAQARVDKLRKTVADLKAQLAECEKKCAPTDSSATAPGDTATPASPLDILLKKLQPDGCKGGQDCTFVIDATNAGKGPFAGPLFLTESGRVAAGPNGADFGAWHCSPTGNGSICLNEAGAAAGETLTLRVPIRLPGRVAKGAENCVEITVALDEKTLVQLIQVGLAARGFDPGLADGVPGPRTRAAIAAFAEKSGQEIDPSDPAAVYRALFGTAPGREKGGAGTKACVPMKVENPPASAPAPPAPAAPAASPDETSQRPTIHLGVNVGDGENRDGEGRGGNDKPGLHITLPGLGGLFNK